MRFANLVLIEIAFGFVAMAEATSAYPRITAISGSEMTTHVPEPRGVGDPTQWYKVQTTSAPDDSHLIGLGNFTQRRKGEEGFFYFECLTAPYTVISGHGGCGRDDVYTACSNDVAFGVDGNMIKCLLRGAVCHKYSIYDDLYATAYTPFICCGDQGQSISQLVRTWNPDSGDASIATTTYPEPPKSSGASGNAFAIYSKVLIGLLLMIAMVG